MLSPFIALFLPPLLLVPAMGLLSTIHSTSPLEIEIRRKLFHVSVGLASLAFPLFLTEPWMVVAAASMALGWMAVVRHVPVVRCHFGAVLHGADRDSHGELYFALSIAALLLASNGAPVFYIIPILILTVADAVAAVVGRAFPIFPLDGIAAGKTTSGSAAFFVAALLVTYPVLLALTSLSLFQAFAAAVTVASATCVAEALSSRGFDNLAVPAVAFYVLKIVVSGA